MLTRGSARLSTLFHNQYRCFSVPAFDAFNDRASKLRSSYPNLFNSSSFLSDQEALLQSYRSNLSSLLNDYDPARKAIDAATGESFFLELTEQQCLQDLENGTHRPFYEAKSEASDLSDKLRLGQEYVDAVIRLQQEQSTATSVEQTNLNMIEIAKYGDLIDEWMLRFPDPVHDSSDLGLPISDAEVDVWVLEQYHHAPDHVREQTGGITYEEHKKVEDAWMRTLDEKLVEVLKSRSSSNGTEFDESKFREFCEVSNELFHPHSIEHYGQSNYAKSLFRAALWQSRDRCSAVEASIERVLSLIQSGRDDDAAIVRSVYETAPDTRFRNLAALQLRILDPLFAAKLVQQVRHALEDVALARAQKDVLRELEVPYLQQQRAELEHELTASMSTNPANMQRQVRVLREQEAAYELEMASLDEVLDELLPRKLWGADISGVKQSIVAYASGAGSLREVDAAIDATLQSSQFDADLQGLDDSEILTMSVKCHNARYADLANFDFGTFLHQTTTKKDFASIVENRRIAARKLSALGVDSLVINVTRIVIEDGVASQLERVCTDYLDIMKKFRGEVDGFVSTAEALDESVFEQIRDALQTANPGKKITLQQKIDPGVASGFIVKAGVQRFDFSLATVIHQGRNSVGAV